MSSSSQKDSLLFILDFWERGGATQVAKDLASSYQAKIFLISGIIPEIPFKNKKLFKKSSLFTVDFSGLRLFVFFKIALNSFISFHHFYQKIDTTNTRLVANLPFSALGVFLHPKTIRMKKDYILHGAFDLEQSSLYPVSKNWSLAKIKFLVTNKLFFLTQKISLHLSDRVIVFSEYSRKIAQQHFNIPPHKIIKVFPQLSLPSKTKKTSLSFFSKKKNELILLVPSRLEPRKGLIILLEALVEVKKKTKTPFKVFCTGEINNHDYAFQLFEFCKNNNLTEVHFIKPIERKILFNWYREVDLVCMPSLELETFGLVTLESLSQGTPVISFNAGATPELLSKVEPKLITKKISAESLAKTLLWYFKLPISQKKNLREKSFDFYKKYKEYDQILLSLY